jgi:hypothetical protein
LAHLVFLAVQHRRHQVLLYLDGWFEVHCEPWYQIHDLIVPAVLAPSPTNQMQIDFFLDFLRKNGMPDQINKLLDGSENLVNHLIFGLPGMDIVLNCLENACKDFQGLLRFEIKGLRDIPGNDMGVVVEMILFSLEVYIGIVGNVVLFHELLWVID